MKKGPSLWYLALGLTFLSILFYRIRQSLAQTPSPEWARGVGPLPIRNQSPIQLLFFQFTPEGAKPLEKGKLLFRVALAETNALKREILKEDSTIPALSARLALKAPTGDSGSAFGSGRPDFGLGLALEKHFGKFAFYTNANLTLPLGRFHGKTVEPIFSGLFSAEYRWTPRFSLVAQFSGITPPFHGTGIPFLGRRVFDVTGGFSLLIDKGILLQGGMIEDIISSTEAGSDVTFFLFVSKIWDGHGS